MKTDVRFFEALAILITLSIISIASGGKFTDWTSAVAVFLGFLHAQAAFDLQDAQGIKRSECGPQPLRSLFILKELVWIATFLTLGSYPLLAGALVFLAYPFVRTYTRPLVRARF